MDANKVKVGQATLLEINSEVEALKAAVARLSQESAKVAKKRSGNASYGKGS